MSLEKGIQMQEQKEIIKRRSIPAFALWGAVGFGIGGATGGIIAVDAATFFGFAIMGGIGGMSLGLALKSWKMAGFLALAGAVGLSIGVLICVFIGLGLGEVLPLPDLLWRILGRFTIAGAVTGVALGLPLKGWKEAGFLALAGSIAFLIVEQVQEVVPLGLITHQLLSRVTQMVIWGVVGGALLGAALGYLEKRKADTQSQVN
jgi:hypothetical protein